MVSEPLNLVFPLNKYSLSAIPTPRLHSHSPLHVFSPLLQSVMIQSFILILEISFQTFHRFTFCSPIAIVSVSLDVEMFSSIYSGLFFIYVLL